MKAMYHPILHRGRFRSAHAAAQPDRVQHTLILTQSHTHTQSPPVPDYYRLRQRNNEKAVGGRVGLGL